MSTTTSSRPAATAAGLALAAAGLILSQASPASAIEYATQSRAGTIQAPFGMMTGSDYYDGDRMVPSIQAGPLLVGFSPSSSQPQRVEVRASLQRYDESVNAWRSTGQSGTATAALTTSWGMVGDGAQAGSWTFTTTQEAASLYRVSYQVVWLAEDNDGDTTDDVVLGQAVIRPSETSENVCDTTPFGNATTVVYEVPCTVTSQGIVI